MIKQLFSMDEVNRGRQKELDLARGFAMLFMILIHAYTELYLDDIGPTKYDAVVHFLGAPPAAPVFMILLGVGIVYSKKSTPKELFRRGGTLFFLGYILNFLRDYVPDIIIANQEQDMELALQAWDWLWSVDILAFAGLTFIFFGLVKRFKLNNWFLAAFWGICTTLNMFLQGVIVENETLNIVCRLIWTTDEYTWFPFLIWITYPIFGYFFGQFFIRCSNKDKFYTSLLMGSIIVSIPLWCYSYINTIRFGAFGSADQLFDYEYFNHDLIGEFVIIAFVLFWLSICYFMTKFMPQVIFKHFERWSKNNLQIYCVHWLIIGFIGLTIEIKHFSALNAFIAGIAILLIADGIVVLINKLKATRLSK